MKYVIKLAIGIAVFICVYLAVSLGPIQLRAAELGQGLKTPSGQGLRLPAGQGLRRVSTVAAAKEEECLEIGKIFYNAAALRDSHVSEAEAMDTYAKALEAKEISQDTYDILADSTAIAFENLAMSPQVLGERLYNACMRYKMTVRSI